MEIKYFKLIKTIAEEGSIANSAAKLYLTQSALSHQLKEIEQRLGFKVFYRKRNKWELTDEGEELYKLGNTILENLEKGFQNIEKLQAGSKGSVRVSTECYSFYQELPAFIQKMAVLYPDINVDLILEATHQPISKILSNEIDIAIVTSKPSNRCLEYVEVHKDEIFAVMHKENIMNESNYLSVSKFKELHLIIHSYPLDTVSIYEHLLKPSHVEPLKISAVPLTEVALEMVAANMGVMCLPKWALKSFNLPKDLDFKRIGKDGFKRKHYVVFRKSDKEKKYINDFISNFKEQFSVD